MNLHHLRVFDVVAREQSISHAGKELLVSQPAVSKQLQLLEKHFRCKLVERQPRGVELTDAGNVLAGYSRQIFALCKEAERAVGELQGLRRGQLRVGASTTIGSYYLPHLLAEFRRKYPSVDLQLEVANTELIQQYLIDRKLDIALTEGFLHFDALIGRVFHVDELVPIVSPVHPLLQKQTVTLQTFCKEPLLLREHGSGTREVIEQALTRRKIRIRPLMTLGNTEAIKRSVAAGVGVAFVSALSIQQELESRRLVLLKLRDFALKRSLHIVQRRSQSLSAAAQAFLSLLSGHSV